MRLGNPIRQMPEGLPLSHRTRRTRHLLTMSPEPSAFLSGSWRPATVSDPQHVLPPVTDDILNLLIFIDIIEGYGGENEPAVAPSLLPNHPVLIGSVIAHPHH